MATTINSVTNVTILTILLLSCVQDHETQRRLEMLHRNEEDLLYKQFSKKRQEEEYHISTQIKEEWEKELERLTSKFVHEVANKRHKHHSKMSTEEEKTLTLRLQREKEDLEKNMTIRLGRKKESLTKKLLEIERQATADLVEKQSKEMMNLITEKMQEFSVSNGKENDKNGGRHRSSNGHSKTKVSTHSGRLSSNHSILSAHKWND